MKTRMAFCFVTALVVSVFGLAACGGGDQAQQPDQQDQGAQPSPSPAQGGNRAPSGLMGTWEATSTNGNPPAADTFQTFLADGTLQTELHLPFGDTVTSTGKYRLLDDSRIELIDEGATEGSVFEYSLEGDTLTMTYEDPGGMTIQNTYQRRS